MKCAVSVSSDPEIISAAAHDRSDCARRNTRFVWLKRITAVEQTNVVAAPLRAKPQVTFAIGSQRVDEIAAGLADNLFRFTVFDRHNTATLRTCVELVSGHCEAGDLQWPRMIF